MEITKHQLSGDTVTARMLTYYCKVIVPRFIVVAARTGLNVRSGPGSDHAVAKVLLASGMRLTVRHRSEPWCASNLQGDGAIDGYAHTSFLRAAH